ncbi:MAG: hypothetical protein RIQ79_1620, partial [Verrucomicrobiota bacterium]
MPLSFPTASFRRSFAVLAFFGVTALARALIPAFPGAEGYGAYAAGGRGGDVYYVTNLNSSGTGSLSDAIATTPAAGRTIMFAVSGYIHVPGSNLRITASKITIAGQSAPGDGVGLKDGTFRISGDDIIVRHLRFRHGKYGSGGDCIDLDSGCLNAVLDHISMQFSTDENISSFGSPPENLTLQYSLNSWGLESHSCGGLWDQNHATSHHNLWSHNHTRNPKARPNGLLEWINNVTFDWDIGFIMGDSQSNQNWKANLLNNYFICPPGNLTSKALVKGTVGTNNLPNFTVFLAGNLIDNDGDGLLNGTDKGYSIVEGSVYSAAESPAAVPGDFRYYQSASAITGSTAAVSTDSPLLAYKKIVSNAGALRLDSTYTGAIRDEVDSILVSKLTSQTAYHVTRESDTGASNAGFGFLNSTAAPIDADRDGMPDFWETALGFNPALDDHNTAFTGSGGVITGTTFFPTSTPLGYTRLEEYLHFLAIPHASLAKNTAAAPSSLAIDLRKFTAGFANSPVFTLSGVTGGSAVQSGTGGYLVTFTPTVNTSGRARFEFAVTDADGSTWTQTFALLVSTSAFPRDLVWKGDAVTNTWDEAASNWLRNGTATAYAVGDRVAFDDTGSRSPSVAINIALAPGSMDVDTTSGYTFAGNGTLTSTGPFAKRGTGPLSLGVPASFAGGYSLDGGALTLTGTGGLTGGTLTMQDGTSITNGLGANPTANLATSIAIPAGQTATLYTGNRLAWAGSLTGAGTFNVVAQSTVTRADLKAATAAFAGTINFTGSGGVRLFTVGGAFNGYTLATLNLGGSVNLQPQTNSGGNTYPIGALTGTSSSAVLTGGSAGTATYTIGSLNQSTTFAGAIQGNAALTKTGTGTLRLTLPANTVSLSGATTSGNTTVTLASTSGLYSSMAVSGTGISPGATIASVGNSTILTLSSNATLTGNSTLSFTGGITYTGATTVSGGGLSVDGNIVNSPVSIAAGTVLSGTGTPGFVTVASGGIVSPGASAGTAIGTLTPSSLALNAPILRFDLSSNPAGTNDKIQLVAGGALSLTGNQTFQFSLTNGTLGAGTYNLINTTGTGTASGVTFL